MALRGLNSHDNTLLLLTLPLQGNPEQGQRPEALEPAQARLDVELGSGQPPLRLIGGAPAVHLGDPLLHETVQGFETVRRLQTGAEVRKETQPMERQRLLQSFVETPHRRLVQEAEFRPAAPAVAQVRSCATRLRESIRRLRHHIVFSRSIAILSLG